MVRLLSYIPNLEDLSIKNIHISACSSSVRDELDLYCLKSLLLDYCAMPPTLLDRIPAGVISNLVFTFQSCDETCYQNFFNRQLNIKRLELFENDQLSFDHLQLEHIKISSNIDLPLMISQQPKLNYVDFAITWVDDPTFTTICQLRNLETLKTLLDQISCHEFKNLKNLSMLKELRLDTHSPYDRGHLLELAMMKLTQLEKLTLVCTDMIITDEVLHQMSINFVKLEHVEFINRSIQIVVNSLQLFPKLKSLFIDFFSIFGAPEDILNLNEDFRHESLQQIVMTNINRYEDENTIEVLKLVNACPNLERILLTDLQGFNVENFRVILENHQSLTHLSLDINADDEFYFDDEVIDLIKRFGRNLVHLRFNGLASVLSDEELRNSLGNKFPTAYHYFYLSRKYELIMKKRGIPDWFTEFKLMGHF